MDWKMVAVDKLKQYEAKRLSLEIIPREIEEIETTMTSIRSARVDGTAIKNSSGNGREAMLLNCIVKKDELKRNLECAKLWISIVEKALSILDQEERVILDRFFIQSERCAADRLAGDLHIEVSTVYRRREKALRKFTIALYGLTES